MTAMAARGPLDGFLTRRAALIAAAEPGTTAARALSDLTDGAVSARTEAASDAVRVPFAVFALGGYGARRLLPASDIDLLIVSPGSRSAIEPLVCALLYPLWDAGLAVGHQVRTPREQTAALTDDVRNATAFLTARCLAGDDQLALSTLAKGFARMRTRAGALREVIASRKRPGSPYLLGPDLKDGAGGQRDIDELVWLASLAAGRPAGLQDSPHLMPDEISALDTAQDAITAARWRLHVSRARGENVLALEDAPAAGIDSDNVQRALETVHFALLRARAGARQRAVAPPAQLDLHALRRAALEGDDGLPAMELAAHEGAIDALLPGFSSLMTLRRPALSHRYTVGAHCLRTLAHVGAQLEHAGVQPLSRLYDPALVAALAHDVGKRLPTQGHPARGAVAAGRAALALGLAQEDSRTAEALVREHLLLAEAASRVDPADEDSVLECAALIADERLVAPLFALTAADMMATGPDVWTPWRAALVADLAQKLEAALSPDVDGAGIVAAAEGTRTEAVRMASSEGASRAVLDFLAQAPLRYLAGRDPADALRDARLVQSIAGPGAPGRFGFSVSPGPAEGTWVIDIVTRDRPGLFGTLSGTLALSGLNALSAEAHTSRSGIAIDRFVITSATLAPVDTETWNRLDRALVLAISGTLDLETRLAERRRHYPAHASGAPVRVEIGKHTAFTAAVRIRAADRVGLLHDLAHAVDDAGLCIARASITTAQGLADDLFELTATGGDAPDAGRLERELLPLLEKAATG